MIHSYSHYISSFGIVIKLTIRGSSSFSRAVARERFWRGFVPGFTNQTQTNPELVFNIIEDNEFRYTQPSHVIYASINDTRRIVVIIEAQLEYMRQKKSLYTMHGAIIMHKNTAIALIGAISGIGKTTLAAHASKHGWQWSVDEKFTIHDNVVIGGTTTLLDDSKSRTAAANSRPRKLRRPYPISLVCQPIVTNELSLTSFELSNEKAYWTIYNELTRDIRQVDGIVDEPGCILQSYDTESLTYERALATKAFVISVPVVQLRGSAHDILSYLMTKISQD